MAVWQWVVTVCGGIATVGGAAAVLRKMLAPLTDLSKRVGVVEAHDKQDMERFTNIDAEFARSEKADQALYKAQLAIINHLIDGNHVDKLRAARDALQEHIIEH